VTDLDGTWAKRRALVLGDGNRPLAAALAYMAGLSSGIRGEWTAAMRWWERAAEEGDPRAAFRLAELLAEQGEAAEQLAHQWCLVAAVAGHAMAAAKCGVHARDEGNEDEAIYWLGQAVERGLIPAAHDLALICKSRGELEEARRWYTRAAGGGFVPSAVNLGVLAYQSGDFDQAHHWWTLASEAGNEGAGRNLRMLDRDAPSKLPSDELGEDQAVVAREHGRSAEVAALLKRSDVAARQLEAGTNPASNVATWEHILAEGANLPLVAGVRAYLASYCGKAHLNQYLTAHDVLALSRAIECFEEAVDLDAGTRAGVGPLGRLSNLGVSLVERFRFTGDQTDLTTGMEYLEQAAEADLPPVPQRLEIKDNFAIGLWARYLRFGRVTDLEESVRVLESALGGIRIPWTDSQIASAANLGGLMHAKHCATLDDQILDHAIELLTYAEGAAEVTALAMPTILTNLGVCLQARYNRTQGRADLELAIACYEIVADAFEASPPPFVLENLAWALGQRATDVASSDRIRRVELLRRAAAMWPDGSPDRARALGRLAAELSAQGSAEGDLELLAEAVESARLALTNADPSTSEAASAQFELGAALRARYTFTHETEELHEAIQAWEAAWSASWDTHTGSPVEYRLGQLVSVRPMFANELILALVELAQLQGADSAPTRRRALEVAEAAKSRMLTELLSRGELPVPPTIDASDAALERRLLDELNELDRAELALARTPQPIDAQASAARLSAREACWNALVGLWDHMSQCGVDAADYVALRRGDALNWAEMSDLTASGQGQTVLASLFVTTESTVLFLLRSGDGAPTIVRLDLSERGWADIHRLLVQEVNDRVRADSGTQDWYAPLAPLAEAAAAQFANCSHIVVAPHRQGHLIPWSVVAHLAGWRNTSGAPAAIVTVPSLSVLHRLRRRPTRAQGGRPVVMGDPTEDLRGAGREASEVARVLGCRPLLGPEASRRALLECLPNARVLHMAMHAGFSSVDPLASGLELSDGRVTAREILRTRCPLAKLVVLSACETGVTGSLGGEELVGLSMAFLQAGARAVVVSLWRVDDPATAALMTSLHSRLGSGLDAATALALSMQALRSDDRYAHPYYWGAFAIVGDWSGSRLDTDPE
jgi:hypothetical protein